MPAVPNLRVVKVRSEILNVLLKIYVNDSKVLIWQKEHDKKRFVNTAHISNVDENVGVFHLRSTTGAWSSEIKGTLSLYFKGDEESILFKVKNIIMEKDELIIPIPSEVRLLEKRSSPRIEFSGRTEKNFLVIQKIFENGKRKQFSVTILDISKNGVAVSLTRADGKYFYEGDNVFIIELAGKSFSTPMSGKLVYLRPVEFLDRGMKSKGFRAGVQFSGELTSDQLNFLTSP